MDPIFFHHSSVKGHVDCFHFCLIQIEQQWHGWASAYGVGWSILCIMLNNSIEWSWDKLIPNFFKNFHTGFYRGSEFACPPTMCECSSFQFPWLQVVPQSYSNKTIMALAQKQDMFVDQWDQIEDSDINVCIYGPLIFLYM